ncbi:hypothetical protein [Bradyrhizobium ivorense]|uniref:hypothetical protein n=1 Tax=Bradyrhizobium ivorense TaxID=2511166 RepID=UPI001E60A8D2|nr:hypothetical protein [Bradyrhizobium ivorense]
MSVSAEVLARAPLEQLAGEIDPLSSPRPRSNIRPLSPMPDYVEHRNGVNEVGKLSAEAVVREYEAAVKEIEALGTELQLAAKNCEAMVAGVHEMIAEIKEFAAGYRDQGKRFFLKIEAVSLMTTEVRDTCEALKKKIATDTLSQ